MSLFVPQVGRFIREARLKRGLTLRNLARILRIDPGSLSRVETGKRAFRNEATLLKVLAYLGIQIHLENLGDYKGIIVTCPRCLCRTRLK